MRKQTLKEVTNLMNAYMEPLREAIIAFPFVAALFTLPYVVLQYKRYGAIPLIRSLIVYSFILYLMCAYFLVILPLPPVAEVAAMTGPTMQLIPFSFVTDIAKQNTLPSGALRSMVSVLQSSSVLQVLFNLLMFVPLGIYLHYYFERKWYQTLLLSLGVSLFFELTQLSGLYGMYPRPYRLFDVDDLMINTLGGMLGYAVTPLFMKVLPSRGQINELAYKHGERVSFMRRLFAWSFDFILLLSVTAMLSVATAQMMPDFGQTLRALVPYVLAVLLCNVVLPVVTRGITLGRWLMATRMATPDGKRPRWYQYLTRAAAMYGLIMPAPIYMLLGITLTNAPTELIGIMVACAVVGSFVLILFVLESFAQLFGRRKDYMFCRISGTCEVSCVERPKLVRRGVSGNAASKRGKTKAKR